MRLGGIFRSALFSPNKPLSLFLRGQGVWVGRRGLWGQGHGQAKGQGGRLGCLVVGGGLVVGGICLSQLQSPIQAASIEEPPDPEWDKVVPGLPEYRMSEVASHYDKDRKIWVSFSRGVYDITEFVRVHPGGDRILMAAGGSLEPFWQLYPVHLQAHVLAILRKYRIGNLVQEDVLLAPTETDDPWAAQPRRHPVFIQRSAKPFNGETPPELLSQTFYTPNDVFYIRNHLPVPQVDTKSYELEVEGIHLQSKSFSLAQLKAFPPKSISATIQCGGNRRSEMGQTKGVAGLAWTGGAIGTAKWTGIRLRDLLQAAGFNPKAYPNPEKLHVQFEGLDSDQSGECYGSSVPLATVLDDNFEGILAFEMNGEPLPVDHGFPVRIILPGIVGARSVKWLCRIRISEEESQSPWQQRDYKVFSPGVTMETVDFSKAPAIQDTPVTSYIASHQNQQAVPAQGTLLQGYAFSGGGRDIVRVEVSRDRGQSWEEARIVGKAKDGSRNWAWVLWEQDLKFKGEAEAEVWVKAVDSGYNQQAEDFRTIWNYRGLLANAIHKITLIPTKS